MTAISQKIREVPVNGNDLADALTAIVAGGGRVEAMDRAKQSARYTLEVFWRQPTESEPCN